MTLALTDQYMKFQIDLFHYHLPAFKRSQLFHTLPTQAIFKPPVLLVSSDYSNREHGHVHLWSMWAITKVIA